MTDQPAIEAEQWMQLWGNPYLVSSFGRVLSIGRKGAAPRLLIPQTNPCGYYHVGLTIDGEHSLYRIHQLVLWMFVGEAPEGHECAHLDGNPKNNLLSNLKWVTRKENAQHRIKHGTWLRGERCHSVKLTEQDVLEIRANYVKGEKKLTDWAKEYGVTLTTIKNVISRVTWKHI